MSLEGQGVAPGCLGVEVLPVSREPLSLQPSGCQKAFGPVIAWFLLSIQENGYGEPELLELGVALQKAYMFILCSA